MPFWYVLPQSVPVSFVPMKTSDQLLRKLITFVRTDADPFVWSSIPITFSHSSCRLLSYYKLCLWNKNYEYHSKLKTFAVNFKLRTSNTNSKSESRKYPIENWVPENLGTKWNDRELSPSNSIREYRETNKSQDHKISSMKWANFLRSQ